jgi:hypothetical protein
MATIVTMAAKKTSRKLFPKPGEVTDENPVAWRSTDDVVQIANETNGWEYANLAVAVQDWTRGHAITLGWSAVYFPLAYPSRTLRAGAVFVK